MGWSVGWFSIPFYSLVRPYQVLAEIRAAADEPGNTAHAQAGRTLAGWWWGTFLAMGFVNRALGAAWRTAKTAEEMISAPFVGFASYAATIVAALVAMLLVRTITGGQERMAARIGQPQQPTDAASPVD